VAREGRTRSSINFLLAQHTFLLLGSSLPVTIHLDPEWEEGRNKIRNLSPEVLARFHVSNISYFKYPASPDHPSPKCPKDKAKGMAKLSSQSNLPHISEVGLALRATSRESPSLEPPRSHRFW
jgi:hypothetical protein